MYIDSHAHIHDKAFAEDRPAVVARMREAGVHTALLVGCDLGDSASALESARAFGLYASAGIHPHEAKDAPADIEAALEPLLADPRLRAIGETGLDYYYNHSPRETQQRVMREQIALAKRRDLPLVFHHRDAYDDFTAILREELDGARGVIHCFTGDAEQAQTYTREFGLYLGIGGVVTFKSAQPIRDAVAAVGLDRLILETDCPYLAPVPHRGQRNEPAYIPTIAQRVAEILHEPVERVAEVTSANTRALFGLS